MVYHYFLFCSSDDFSDMLGIMRKHQLPLAVLIDNAKIYSWSTAWTDLECLGLDSCSLLLGSESPLLCFHLLPPPELVDLRSCDAVHRDCCHVRWRCSLWEAGFGGCRGHGLDGRSSTLPPAFFLVAVLPG